MQKRLILVIFLYSLILLISASFKFIISQIKIISFLFFIILSIFFFMIFKECLCGDKVEELKKKEERQILAKEVKKIIEDPKKEDLNKINYKEIIYKTNDSIKNICKNILDLFYKNDNKKYNTFKIYKSKIIKTFSYRSAIIKKILLLKDGRLALSSFYKSNEYIYSILIYDIDSYSIDLEICNLTQRVCDLMQTNNGNIISSLTRGFIFVFKTKFNFI